MSRSQRELSHEYVIARIGVDTAENEPSKVPSEIGVRMGLSGSVLLKVYVLFRERSQKKRTEIE